ncbi:MULTISPECIES: hypothetical protein [unclassified Pseudomonas]|uniref:hypothetical protein n=1 Tax=unclassified Pseudomonas TaxID=196821 RepID=UPI0017858A68|nr:MULTISPECIES: hypothetical protein [unclassified Pseudomonas]MBD8623065.1 hypothetical protein [Pseudomonas sp. CFBP 13727]MBD8732133.1 hypothetical protein [Pseudomonas sp. CFBP 13710]
MSVILISIVCIIFWTTVSWLSGTAEPWDAAGYWTTVYPAALVLSAILGAIFLRLSLIAGAIVMFAQLPVVVVSAGVSPLLAVGVIYVALLSIPAMMISWVSGKLRLFCSG